MDGFIRPPKHTAQPSQVAAKPKPPVIARANQPAPKVGHTTQSSQTLMRHAVSQPSKETSAIHAKATPVSSPSQPSPKTHSLLYRRQKRAAQTNQSSSISRFSNNIEPKVHKKYQPLAVQPHPHDAKTIAAPASKASHSFEAALQNATSHQQPHYKASKRRHHAAKKLGLSVRALNIGAISLAVVLLAGFITYQNVPNISMRVASSKAGFNASLPGYTPSGFSMAGPIQTTPGAVTVSFRSNSDGNRAFSVKQTPSNWTSSTLLSNQVAVNQQSYQTYQDKGKTIYIYNGTNATWVNGGVLYEVSGNAQLNSEQLLRIADSL